MISLEPIFGLMPALLGGSEIKLMKPMRLMFCTFVFMTGLVATDLAHGEEPASTSATGSAINPNDMGFDEAVRVARDLLDRYESMESADEKQTALNDISRLLVRAQSLEPASSQLLYLRGRALVAADRKGEAIDELKKFLETREGRTEWRAFQMLGDLFVEEYGSLAKSNYEKARSLNPGEPETLYGLSRAALKQGETDDALKLANETVSLDGRKTAKYVTHLARVLVVLRRWSEAEHEMLTALDLAKSAMKSKPGDRAAVQTVQDQYGSLIEVLQAKLGLTGRAPSAVPPGSTAQATMGDDFVRLADYVRGRSEAAAQLAKHDVLAVLESGIRRTSPKVPVRLAEQQAIALADVGRTEAAITAFEAILKYDPQNATAQEWLKRLRSGTGKP